MTKRDRWGSFGQFISNWGEYEGPPIVKLGLAARNLTFGRVTHGFTCCGHHGQPGC